MAEIRIRPAGRIDLPRLTEIYNHYVIHSPATFDLEPHTVERRLAWFDQFSPAGRHRLLVAESVDLAHDAHDADEADEADDAAGAAGVGTVVGYAGTMRFRPKAAYDTTVETTVYCSPEAMGQGIGGRLYAALFDALAGEDIRRILAGYVLPNPASAALHERFGFRPVGVFSENGRKFGRYWDVMWTERPLRFPAE